MARESPAVEETISWIALSGSSVEERPKFEIDLRVAGVSQDAILKDEQQMKEINNTLERLKRLKSGSCTKSIRDDQKKQGDMMFSEESSRVIHEMGNMELIELVQISVIIQCHAWLNHFPERLKYCGCGVCLRPGEDTTNRIKARCQALIVPYHFARVNRSRGKKH